MLKAPFILLERNGDLTLYRSLDTLARSLEPVDVRNEGYQVFDSLGSVLELRIESEKVQRLPWFFGGDIWRERINPIPAEEGADPAKLRAVLLRALAASPGSSAGPSANLEELITLAGDHFGIE